VWTLRDHAPQFRATQKVIGGFVARTHQLLCMKSYIARSVNLCATTRY
jgi:hypothetical protein